MEGFDPFCLSTACLDCIANTTAAAMLCAICFDSARFAVSCQMCIFQVGCRVVCVSVSIHIVHNSNCMIELVAAACVDEFGG